MGAKKWSHIFATFETEAKIFAVSDTSFPSAKNNAKSTANSTAKSKAAKKAKCKAKAKLRTTLLAKLKAKLKSKVQSKAKFIERKTINIRLRVCHP